MASHGSWQDRPALWEAPPAPDRPEHGFWDLGADDGHATDKTTAEEAGCDLARLLSGMFLAGQMSAKLVCEVAWYAHHAGAAGAVSDLMYRPGSSTGNFSRHLRKVLATLERGPCEVESVSVLVQRVVLPL